MWILFAMVMVLWVYFNLRKRPSVNRASQVALRDLETAEPQVSGRCNSQRARIKTKRQCELRLAVTFFETLPKA
jgi:Na+/melibiose symporter-like transporter